MAKNGEPRHSMEQSDPRERVTIDPATFGAQGKNHL